MRDIERFHRGILFHHKNKRKKLITDSLRSARYKSAINLEDVHKLHNAKGLLDLVTFKKHIKDLFPLYLDLVAEHGTQATACRLMGIKPQAMADFLQRYPELLERVHLAAKIKKDRKALERIELQEILS